jgi:predicted urease superfamily metal-dependent hydrolase
VNKRVLVLMVAMLVALAAGCTRHEAANASDTQNANANANATAANGTTTAGPDNSEITTSVDANGTRTETRTFKNNPRISRVVVTTRDGRRTVRAVSPSGEEREVNTDENVLEATGDKVAAAAGFVADKTKDAVGEAGDKAEDVKDKTVSGAKKVGSEAADKAEDVGDKTVSGAKKVGSVTADKAEDVGDKTVSGAKKVGSATKKAVKKVIP